MKDKCNSFKRTNVWKYIYAPRIKAIESELTDKSRPIWNKLSTCSKIKLVDKFESQGNFKYKIGGN